MAESERKVEPSLDAKGSKVIVVTQKTTLTLEEAQKELENMIERKKSAEQYKKQFDTILKTPSYKEWEANMFTWEKLKFQNTVQQSNKENMLKSADMDIEILDKAIEEIKKALK